MHPSKLVAVQYDGCAFTTRVVNASEGLAGAATDAKVVWPKFTTPDVNWLKAIEAVPLGCTLAFPQYSA